MLVLNFLCEQHILLYHASLSGVFYMNFHDIEYQLQQNILYHFLNYSVFKNLY